MRELSNLLSFCQEFNANEIVVANTGIAAQKVQHSSNDVWFLFKKKLSREDCNHTQFR